MKGFYGLLAGVEQFGARIGLASGSVPSARRKTGLKGPVGCIIGGGEGAIMDPWAARKNENHTCRYPCEKLAKREGIAIPSAVGNDEHELISINVNKGDSE